MKGKVKRTTYMAALDLAFGLKADFQILIIKLFFIYFLT